MASVSKKDFEDFKVSINAKLMKLDKLDIILANQNELSLKFVSLKADIEVIKSDGIERGNRIRELESQLNAHKASCELLSKELLLVDLKSRKKNLIIHGLRNEKGNQTLESNVKSWISDTLGISSPITIDNLYRLGSKTSNNITTRRGSSKTETLKPVFLSLSNDKDVQLIMRNVGKLKGSGARVVSDLPPKLNDIRNNLLAKAKGLREAGKWESSRIKQKGADLWLEVCHLNSDKWIKYDDQHEA